MIQEGLMNPSADILEAMVETEATCKGRVPYLFWNIFKTLVLLIVKYIVYFLFKFLSFFNLDTVTKPAESLEQIAAYDVEKLLSKSSELNFLSENLLQLRQSLTKEWGSGSVGTLPEDSIQKLVMEVGFI